MPIFKKSSSDSGHMLEIHRKVLHRCRILLVKDLDTPNLLDYLSGEDGFKQDFRDQIQALPNRDVRVAAFLDRLETRGERAFGLFMEAMKEHYRHMHYVLEESIRNLDETRASHRRERASLSGDAIRKVLRTNYRRKVGHLSGASQGGDSVDDLDVLIEARDDDQYIECYSIPLRGRVQSESWIRQTRVLHDPNDVTVREGVTSAARQQREDSSYMATLSRDLVFRAYDDGGGGEVPKAVKQPPKYCKVFVVDTSVTEDGDWFGRDAAREKAAFHGDMARGSRLGGGGGGGGRGGGQVPGNREAGPVREDGPPRSEAPAPPVPPKPDHLPPLMLRPPSFKARVAATKTLPSEQKPPPVPSAPPPAAAADDARDSDCGPPEVLPPPPPRTTSKGRRLEEGEGFKPRPLPKPTHPGIPEMIRNLSNKSLPSEGVNGAPPAVLARDQPAKVKDDASSDEVAMETDFPVEDEFLPGARSAGSSCSSSVGGGASQTEVVVCNGERGGGERGLAGHGLPTPRDSLEDGYHPSNTSTQTLTYEQERRLEEIESMTDETYETVTPKGDREGRAGAGVGAGGAEHEGHEVVSQEEEEEEEEGAGLVFSAPIFASHDHEVLSPSDDTAVESGGDLDSSKGSSPERSTPRRAVSDPRTHLASEESSRLSGDSEGAITMSSITSDFQKSSIDSGVDTASGPQVIKPPAPVPGGGGGGGGGAMSSNTLGSRPMPRPPPPVMLPRSLSEVQVRAEDNYASSNDGSYYEDIDACENRHLASSPSKASCSYLDPKSYMRSCERAPLPGSDPHPPTALSGALVRELQAAGKVLLRQGDLLIADSAALLPGPEGVAGPPPPPEDPADGAEAGIPTDPGDDELSGDAMTTQQRPTETQPLTTAKTSEALKIFQGTILTFDRQGRAFYVPRKHLKKYGDPEGESWFYPVEMSSRQAALFLNMEKQEGCFVVYRPTSRESTGAAFNLSLCRANGDVVHYHIMQNVHGDVMIEGHNHSFMNIRDLVDYFRRNKSQLATRLNRPLKEARMPVTPGYHYDLRREINRKSLELTGKIIGKGNFGVVCAGIYQSRPVAVKVLQKGDVTVMDEDDFIEEAKVMMGLDYDHVVRLIGLSCTARPFFLVTEYVARGSLSECLRSGVLSSEAIDTLFDVCIQTASALFYLESQQYIIHRDVAARNFLVAEDMCVKLADFGRARYVTDDYYQAPRSEKVPIRWAAPEVLTDSVYSTRSDVWSLGVVFWEVFSAGERPYGTLSGEQNAIYVTEGGRLDKPPGCPSDLFALMKSCWRDEAQKRPTFTVLYEKLKSKTNIYYSGPFKNASHNKRTSNESGKSNTLAPTTPVRSPTALVPRPTTPSARSRRPLTSADLRTEEYQDHLKLLDMGSRERLGTSSSDTSLVSGMTDPSKDELTRSEKIRKSLRKLVNSKSKRKSKLDSPVLKRPEDRAGPGQFYNGS